jgi:MFS family permease
MSTTTSTPATREQARPSGSTWKPTQILPKHVTYASVIAFLAWFFSVYDFNMFGTLLPKIRVAFGWSSGFATTVSDLVSVATFLAALCVGPLIDRFGRRLSMIFTTAAAAISSGLTGLTVTPIAAPWIIAVRYFSGFGYSEQAVNSTYLNELYSSVEDDTQRTNRGFLYSLVQGGWPLGVMFGAAIVALVLPGVGWRGTFLIATFPAVIIALLGRRLKESPKYEVLKRARELEAEGRTEEVAELKREYGVDLGDTSSKASYASLFEPAIIRHTLFLCVAFLLNWFGVQVLSVLSTTVLTSGKHISYSSSLIVIIISNSVAFVGYMLAGYLGDRIPRRNVIGVGWLCSGICYMLMLYVVNGYWPVVILNALGLFFLIGPYSALLFYMGESYPTRYRASGTSFANAMGPVGAILGGLVFTALINLGTTTASSAVIAGAVPILISGVLIFGARSVAPGTGDPDFAA